MKIVEEIMKLSYLGIIITSYGSKGKEISYQTQNQTIYQGITIWNNQVLKQKLEYTV